MSFALNVGRPKLAIQSTLCFLNLCSAPTNKIEGRLRDLNADYIAYEMFVQLKNCLYLWKQQQSINPKIKFSDYFNLAPSLFELIFIQSCNERQAEKLYQNLFNENTQLRIKKEWILKRYKFLVGPITNALKAKKRPYIEVYKKIYNISLSAPDEILPGWKLNINNFIQHVKLGKAIIFSGTEVQKVALDEIILNPKGYKIIPNISEN